jgi:tRNA pseudouridine38-40 synthase
MKRYFFEIAYNGSSYFGWQKQPRQHSVQAEIENCLSKLHSNEPIQIVGCGRTDTGVHANNYFFHVDLPQLKSLDKFQFKLNRMLPNSIVVHAIVEVEATKHARFDAKNRTYRYFMHSKKNPFIENSWYYPKELNIAAMNTAAEALLGTQDFTSLSKLHTDVKTNICTVYKTHWYNENNQLIFEIEADRFLRNMVRATVGTLIEVGAGKLEPKDISTILAAKDRQAAKTSVPAHGLFLWEVVY